MQWNELYGSGNEPTESQIREYIDSPLFEDLDIWLRQTFNVKPKLFYSNCAMDKGLWKGWNVKYKKSGKALCTIYPKQGYILSLVPVGEREMTEAELLMPLCTVYTQNLFKTSASGRSSTSLAFVAENEDVLHDMKSVITLRVAKH